MFYSFTPRVLICTMRKCVPFKIQVTCAVFEIFYRLTAVQLQIDVRLRGARTRIIEYTSSFAWERFYHLLGNHMPLTPLNTHVEEELMVPSSTHGDK